MKYRDLGIALGFLLVIIGMMIMNPASAAVVCEINNTTAYKVCYEINDNSVNLPHPSRAYKYWTYTVQPSYNPEIRTLPVPHHNEGDCMISMGCTR